MKYFKVTTTRNYVTYTTLVKYEGWHSAYYYRPTYPKFTV